MENSSSSSSFQQGSLQRGKACIRCRHRKTRCDGARPFCAQCIHANRTEDCEYSDTQGRTRTQRLEENIALLEARIHELENPDESVLLHDPYEASAAGGRGAGASAVADVDPIARMGAIQLELEPAALSWWELEEPPTEITDILVTAFLPHASTVGFALSPTRFRAVLGLPTLHPARPHPALVHAVLLWALRFSNIPELVQHAGLYLQRALLALQNTLGSVPWNQWDEQHAQRRVHVVQAEVLLAQHFLTGARTVQGRYHANAAVALALGCSLHRITHASASAPASPATSSGVGADLLTLAPARDVLELGERVRVFWAVYAIDRCWSAALGTPCALADDVAHGTHIDTPWPRKVEDYERLNDQPLTMVAFAFEPSGRTAQRFLTGNGVTRSEQLNQRGRGSGSEGDSSLALLAKAAALYDAAARPAASSQTSTAIDVEVQALANVTARFARGLAPLDQPDAREALAVVHSLAHAAMVCLHGVRVAAAGAGASIMHANEILMILQMVAGGDMRVVDPMLSIVGVAAARVFCEECHHVRRGPQTYASRARLDELRANARRVADALRRCGGAGNGFPVFAQQADKVEEMLSEHE